MPRKSGALLSTDRQVAGAKPPAPGTSRAEYRVAGTPNLVLRVSPTGRRTWMYWLKRPKTSRWQKFTIGDYPAKTLKLAREETVRLKRSVLDGDDPIAARDAAKAAMTVRALGADFIKWHARPKKRSWRDDERKLEREVYPKLGHVLIDQVTTADLVELLNGILDRGAPIQANRTLALLRKLFNWGVAEGYLGASPARGIPSRANEEPRTRSLSNAEIRLFWSALDNFEDITADALRLQLLLGARVREITGMARNELDMSAATPVWTLPKARAKANRDVLRPLPTLALNIIERRLKVAGTSPYVFASPAEPMQSLTARAPSNALRRAGEAGRILVLPTKTKRNGEPRTPTPAERKTAWQTIGFTPHDLRRTCRTYLAKLGVAETVAKKILGHKPPRSDVTAAVYDMHDYMPEMLAALKLWERHLLGIVEGSEQEANLTAFQAV